MDINIINLAQNSFTLNNPKIGDDINELKKLE